MEGFEGFEALDFWEDQIFLIAEEIMFTKTTPLQLQLEDINKDEQFDSSDSRNWDVKIDNVILATLNKPLSVPIVIQWIHYIEEFDEISLDQNISLAPYLHRVYMR